MTSSNFPRTLRTNSGDTKERVKSQKILHAQEMVERTIRPKQNVEQFLRELIPLSVTMYTLSSVILLCSLINKH